MTPPAVFSPAPSKKAKKPRGHRRIDWLNVGAAVVALVTAVGAGSFAGAQIASASPADDAVQVLITDEATLAGTEEGLISSKTRLEESIQTETADAALIRTALGTLTETDERSAAADPAALAAATTAVDGYQAALAEAAIPELPAAYERGSVDEGSLSSVGEAIDIVQQKTTDVDAAAEEMRAARTAVDALKETYTAQLATFANSFTAHAAAEVEEYEVAGDEFRDAVTAAAATVVATPLNGAAGAAALTAYRNAVDALHTADHDERVRIEEEEARERENNRPRYNPPSQPDQPEPTEEPEEPAPTDPGTGGDTGGSVETPEG